MKLYIGTSGWQYYHWRGKFYPQDLDAKNFLKFYAKYFNTVEVNTSFYHFTKKSTFEKWKKEVSKDFLFSIKLHRLFTHFRKLKLKKEDKRILKETIDSYKVLGKNLGPILIQLPPSLKKDLKTLEKFLKNFNHRGYTRTNTRIGADKNLLKLAIEFRHSSWLDKETYNFLKERAVAFIISDSPRWSTEIVKTCDFIYIRFHGKPHLFASKYEKDELERYTEEIKKLKPKILFAYFNNDAEGHAIEDALEFKKFLSRQ